MNIYLAKSTSAINWITKLDFALKCKMRANFRQSCETISHISVPKYDKFSCSLNTVLTIVKFN